MQKRLLFALAISSMMMNAYAVAPGFYMGLQAGPATNGGKNELAQVETPPPTTTTVKPSSTQFGTRLFLGYKNNQYIGSEYGFNYFSTVRYNTKDSTGSASVTCSGTNVRVYDFDVTLKANVPLKNFEVFGRAGVAATYQNTAGAFDINPNSSCGQSKNQFKFVPTFSVGAGYDLSQNWVGDISWTRVAVSGKLSYMDFYGLGISYHFVDTYCGQFLC